MELWLHPFSQSFQSGVLEARPSHTVFMKENPAPDVTLLMVQPFYCCDLQIGFPFLTLFPKNVINFVRSNDIQCEICADQSNEMLLLLYYRDCFNL